VYNLRRKAYRHKDRETGLQKEEKKDLKD